MDEIFNVDLDCTTSTHGNSVSGHKSQMDQRKLNISSGQLLCRLSVVSHCLLIKKMTLRHRGSFVLCIDTYKVNFRRFYLECGSHFVSHLMLFMHGDSALSVHFTWI